MSERDWHAAGGAALALPRPADAAAPARSAPRDEGGGTAPWEEVVPALSPSQHQELLSYAREQDLLPAEPAPALSPAVTAGEAVRALLAQVFPPSGAPTLPPAPFAEPFKPIDDSLDRFQLDVAARALGAPDLFLILGHPGTGKKRVAVEVIRQCARRGERVLLLGSSTAIDTVLEVLGNDPAVRPLRCLGQDERPEHLPALSAGLTSASRDVAGAEAIRGRADAALRQAEERARARAGLGVVWEPLRQLAERRAAAEARLTDTRDALRRVADEVAREADVAPAGSAFASAVQELAKAHAARLAELDAESVELQKERAEAEHERDEARAAFDGVQPLAAARHGGRWWTGLFWKARLDKGLPERLTELETQRDRAEAALAALAEREQDLEAQRERADAVQREERAALLSDETTRRTAELLAREAAGHSELTALRQETRSWRDRLAAASVDLPEEPTAEAVREAERRAAEALREWDRELELARQWHAFVGLESAALARRHRPAVNLAAGPFSSLNSDPFFAEPETRFDLLFVLDAHLIAEDDFCQAARHADRWVLAGEPAPRPVTEAAEPRSGPRRPARIEPAGASESFLARLTGRLHHEPWAGERGRLCCRLLAVPPDQRRYLESESLADNPDIELRILTPPDGEPVLAEVVFPGSTRPARAKEYLLRELHEAPARTRCRTVRWADEDGRLTARFEPCEPEEQLAVGDGVTEWLCGSHTVGFAFDCSTWDRARAEAWLLGQALKADPGRVAKLTAPTRTAPGLAAWLNGFLETPYEVPAPTAPATAFFLPVPAGAVRQALQNPAEGPARRPGAPRQGGAGYELDLADPRQRERLSPDLLKSLPEEGLVNLPEADRVVQKLIELVNRQPGVKLGVTAPYPAQVALIRRLAERSPRLADVRFEAADGWLHQPCDVLVVSLTRSHVSRAVTYGNEPGLLPRLWLAARRQLVVAGDPGTLARRSRWEGACDHFDYAAGEGERAWATLLVRYLRGEGPLQRLFQLLDLDQPV